MQIVFVSGPQGDQHIFEVNSRTDERVTRSLCGKAGNEIHTNPKGYVDVTESKERNPERPVCEKCQQKYKKHPRSPWQLWTRGMPVR